MSDIIRLLPDAVANQIAAGEVVQRPASAVKELLENAVDAEATVIKLIVKDAGKNLIQVIDNGKGMSVVDARMSFERHATSKITKAEDLFNLRTKGFRGEALASIAAVAQVELKTKRKEDALGTKIIIEGSEVKSQEAENCPDGTNFQIKNLFYNIPARRNFLKSNPVELKHIIEEFEHVALVHPEIKFEMSHNGSELFNLPVSNLRQRIVALYGKNYNERLVPLEEQTPMVSLKGYLIKPEFTKKTRGEQFFFVNDRYIRSGYLHHAIVSACDGIIPKENYPSYFIYLEVDPQTIDINIHPTKTEIKFEDERSLYAILHSAARRSLGIHNISPTLDFETDNLNIPLPDYNKPLVEPVVNVDKNFNPFLTATARGTSNGNSISSTSLGPKSLTAMPWKESPYQDELFSETKEVEEEANEIAVKIQLQKKYILCPVKSGLWVIDQSRAHERILFEKFIFDLARQSSFSQQQLFPQMVSLSASDFALLKDIEDDLRHIGFDFSDMGQNSLSVNGTPADFGECNPQKAIEDLLEEVKNSSSEIRKNKLEAVARSLARTVCIKPGKILSLAEMNDLIDQLFACENPNISAYGKPTMITYTVDDIEKNLNR